MTDSAAIPDHERWQGDAAAYALDALDETERGPFERHLADCAQCQAELSTMREAAQALHTTVPALTAPPALGQRLMATVRAEAALLASTHQTTGRRAPTRLARPPTIRARRTVRVLAALATAAVVLVAVITLGPGGSGRTYAGVAYAPGASASIRVSGKSARLRFSRLPTPPGPRIYQVWLQRPGRRAPIPTRALFATTTGSVALPGNLQGVRTVLVTAEPRPNGSLAPTRSPIIIVRLA